MTGHRIRVEAGRPALPAGPVYTIIYRSAQMPGQRLVGCVVGGAQLMGYFRDLRLEVEWRGERSPLDPTAGPERPQRAAPGRWRRARHKIARHKSARAKSTRSNPIPRWRQDDDEDPDPWTKFEPLK
jgi:hypothetical protein